MICYRGITWCCSAHHRPDCRRQLTPEVRQAARTWWANGGGNPDDAPISMAYLCGE